MRDIRFYIQTAKKKQGITSNRELCKLLGVSHNATNTYYNNGSLPADETMVKIAELAKIDTETALLDLAMWRTSGAAQKAYANILQKITQVTAMIIALIGFTLAPTPSHASQNIDNVVKSIECECIL